MDWSLEKILAVIGAIGLPAGIGVGIAMDTKTVGELRFAQACFIVAALVAVVFVTIWGITADGVAIRRILLVGLFYGASGLALVEGVRWSQARHDTAHASEPNKDDKTSPPVVSGALSDGEHKSAPQPPLPKPLDTPSEQAHTPPALSQANHPATKSAKTISPLSVALIFVHPTSPALVIRNLSTDGIIENVKWGVVLYNLNRNERIDPLPIPVQSFDWIRPNSDGGPQALFYGNILPLVNNGDRLIGSAFVDCPKCDKEKYYIVSMIYGEGGWFGEVELTGIPLPEGNSPAQRQAYENALEGLVPPEKRVSIN
jgi:hypothetical protein